METAKIEPDGFQSRAGTRKGRVTLRPDRTPFRGVATSHVDPLTKRQALESAREEPGSMDQVTCTLPCTRWFCQTLRPADVVSVDGVDGMMHRVAALGSGAAVARQAGDEGAAVRGFREALDLTLEAAERATETECLATRLEILRTAAGLALNCGETAEGRRLIDAALAADPSVATSEAWAQLRSIEAWPDAWLVAAIRVEPPDVPALDELAGRYWRQLFGRCRMLTLNHSDASDLAQEAWCRVLRMRHGLRPGGNFPAYLCTVAANLWRDRHRSARRAGPMGEGRIASLDATVTTGNGDAALLADVLPDVNALEQEDKRLLMLDVDEALRRLDPLLREVLVARFLGGESCAEIGRRHGRTEQTVSSWVRQAIGHLKAYFAEAARGVKRG